MVVTGSNKYTKLKDVTPTHPVVGLIHPPRFSEPGRGSAVPAGTFVQFVSVLLYPPVDRGVIHRCAALGQHLREIPVGHPVPAVPAHCPQDDLMQEVAIGENS